MRQISDPVVELAIPAIVTIAEAGSILLFIVMIGVWCIIGERI